jgi:dienelactone hydrolase
MRLDISSGQSEYAAEPLNTRYIDYRIDDGMFEGYLAYAPKLIASAPCVLVAHDWSGPQQSTRVVAEKLARCGYVGFELDVYGKDVRGSLTGDNSGLMAPLMEDRSLLRRRLLAGLRFAQQHPQVDGTRVAVVGFCFGGLCALDLARAAPPGLAGAISVHGVLTPPNIGEQVSASRHKSRHFPWRSHGFRLSVQPLIELRLDQPRTRG